MTDRRGADMHRLISQLYPLCRSITGDGVRETLRRVGEHVPLDVYEVPTGTAAFDWTVPREWNIRDAAIAAPDGRRMVDFGCSNLHVMSYSTPVERRMTFDELRPHLHSLPDRPDWIPYRTSYYAENWGFCVSQHQLDELEAAAFDEYDVMIDSSLTDGSLTYGECVLPGEEDAEFLLSCHVCHPSLANDNLSGIAVLTWLARSLADRPRRFTYRFLFIPGTIGSLTWLSRNEVAASRVRWGLTVAGVGDTGPITYKRSRRDDAAIDRAVRLTLAELGVAAREEPFSPYGYDERQFCSPGFDLPVGCLMRTPHDSYPEYHTSADDLSLVVPDSLTSTLDVLLAVTAAIEADRHYLNLSPKGEPQLGKRGLYPSVGGPTAREEQLAMLWVLNLSDGRHSTLDIAERSKMPVAAVAAAADRLEAGGLLARTREGGTNTT